MRCESSSKKDQSKKKKDLTSNELRKGEVITKEKDYLAINLF